MAYSKWIIRIIIRLKASEQLSIYVSREYSFTLGNMVSTNNGIQAGYILNKEFILSAFIKQALDGLLAAMEF